MEKEYYTKNKLLNYRKKLDFLIQYIDTHHAKDWIHLSKVKLDLNTLENRNNISNSWLANMYYNPYGLWFSCGSSWLKYLKKKKMYYSEWTKCMYVYVVKCHSPLVSLSTPVDRKIRLKNILSISTVEELIDFHCRYAKYKKASGYKINWTQVKRDYVGLVICPYLGEKIWKKEGKKEFENFYLPTEAETYIHDALQKNIVKYPQLYLEWYRHWEAAAGVIWKAKSVESITPVLEFPYQRE